MINDKFLSFFRFFLCVDILWLQSKSGDWAWSRKWQRSKVCNGSISDGIDSDRTHILCTYTSISSPIRLHLHFQLCCPSSRWSHDFSLGRHHSPQQCSTRFIRSFYYIIHPNVKTKKKKKKKSTLLYHKIIIKIKNNIKRRMILSQITIFLHASCTFIFLHIYN